MNHAGDQLIPMMGAAWLVVVLFLVVLAILWVILPFAVFGVKGKLQVLITEVRAATSVLHAIRSELAHVAVEGEVQANATLEATDVVRWPNVKLHSEPSATSAVADHLARGTLVAVTARREGFAQVQVVKTGKVGWVLGEALRPRASSPG